MWLKDLCLTANVVSPTSSEQTQGINRVLDLPSSSIPFCEHCPLKGAAILSEDGLGIF